MKIIDAHLHFSAGEHFQSVAKNAGHLDTMEHLRGCFLQNQVVLGIVMGVDGKMDVGPSLPLTACDGAPPPFLLQCLGIDTMRIQKESLEPTLAAFRAELQNPATAGLKIYAGYQPFYVSDPVYDPFYELAEEYDVPVVIHTGDTANPSGILKYAHPLTVDEAAVRFPRVRFVMAHYGNPWIIDATEVAKKNPNVYLDVSGLAEGVFEAAWFTKTYRGYWEHMKTWLTYLGRYDKVLYGSDWPLVHMSRYIELIQNLIPAQQHTAVFYENALKVFPRAAVRLKLQEASNHGMCAVKKGCEKD